LGAWYRQRARNLLPIMDLQGYLHGQGGVPNRQSRVLVVNHKGVFSGLVVDEILGLKHFSPEQRTDKLPTADATLASYLQFGFFVGDEHWVSSTCGNWRRPRSSCKQRSSLVKGDFGVNCFGCDD